MKKRFSIAYKDGGEAFDAARRFAYTVASGFAETALSLAGGAIRPEAVSAARAAGLTIEALYLPSDGADLFWAPEEHMARAEDALPSDPLIPSEATWETLLSIYNSYFAFAARLGIARVILTPTFSLTPPPVTQKALARFREVAACAKEKGVCLLIENGASAPHFEAVVRACCDGYHGVSFSPARAFHYFGTSSLPPYAAEHLMRLSLDDAAKGVFGYLPTEGDTDFRPFAKSMAPLHFRGTLAISPDTSLPPYAELDRFALASRAYDKLSALLRIMKREEGVI